jgi:charged multivesicular body protein 7
MYFAILAVLVSAAYGLDKNWNGLYATWHAVPFKGFSTLPRQVSENKKWTLKDDQCNVPNSPFRGQRYWLNGDPAVIVLFDKNGVVAGIQSSVLKSKYTPLPGMKGFVDDGDLWTQTAYFVDPNTICTTGRTPDELKNGGTGNGLWIQYGADISKDIFNIPMDENDIKKTDWGSGKCFYSMGQHYWYNVSAGMSCNDFFPNCLLYNGGKLNAFCFAKNAELESSWYDWPHPDPNTTKGFMNPVPDCFFTDPTYKKMSTLHVYFHSNPRFTTNC